MLSRKEIIAALIAEYGDLNLINELNEGICLSCGRIQAGVEPDARCYPCEDCEEDTVFGVEETIITML